MRSVASSVEDGCSGMRATCKLRADQHHPSLDASPARRLENVPSGMRIHHDELLTSDVRLVMLVPAWWPRAGVSFDFSHLNAVSVAFALRGTMQGRASRMRTPCRVEGGWHSTRVACCSSMLVMPC